VTRDRFGGFLAFASVALAVLVVLLAVQNRGLKKDLSACRASHAGDSVPSDALAVGETLDRVPVFDPGGNPTLLEFDSGTHVLLIYSSTCPACEETLPLWNGWLDEGTFGTATVRAVRTDPPSAESPSEASPAALRLPVLLVDRSGANPLRRVYLVPCTLVVGPGGNVRLAIYGVPTEEDRERVREAASL
jgi:thiol-disulfide isomerase/thioredoxin